MLDNNEEEHKIPDFVANYSAFFKDTAMSEPEENTEGHIVEDDLGQMLSKRRKLRNTKRIERYEAYVGGLQNIVVPRLQIRPQKLGTTLKLLQWKVSNGLSDKGFEESLKLIKNLLPEGNTLPKTMYKARKVVCPLGWEA